MVITESKHYGKMDINEVNVHWRPFYLSPCGFCELPFTGYDREQNWLILEGFNIEGVGPVAQ